MSHRLLSRASFLGLGLALFVGCSAEGIFSDSPDDAPAPGPSAGTPLPPEGTGSSGGSVHDGGPSGPAKHDASVDAGPPPPDPGTACATLNQIFTRSCGACGKQQALCLAGPDGGAGHVSDYSACAGEVVGGCIPGTTATESCGNCGTHTKTCSQYCAWNVTSCSGEVAGGCPAGLVSWTTAGCPTGVTERSCSETCHWSSFSGVCSAADYQLQASADPGKTVSIAFPLVANLRTKKVTGSCTSGASLSTSDQYVVAYVRVRNDNARAVTVSAWNAQAPGGSSIDTTLTAYAAVPTSDAELKACLAGAGATCDTTALPCGDTKFGSLAGASAFSIPAGQSRILAVTTNDPYGSGTVVEGPVMLSVRTDSVE